MPRLFSVRSEELVEKAIEVEFLGIGATDAVKIEKRLDPFFPEIMSNAAAGERKILIGIGNAQTTAVDEAGEATVPGDDVWQAGVAMGDDELSFLRDIGLKLDEQFFSGLAKPRLIEIGHIDQVRLGAQPGDRDACADPVIEGARFGVKRMHATHSFCKQDDLF